MKIGVFDSGLGGLVIMKALTQKLPQYDYIYLGDSKRVPYGNRSQQTIYEFLLEAVDYLFKKDCQLIVVACNTASAAALRRIQREYLPKKYPNRRVLGVIIPTVELAEQKKYGRIGVIATGATVASGTYIKEMRKRNSKAKIFQVAAPLLVPIIENGESALVKPALKNYLAQLKNVDTLILGCTHYPILKSEIRKIFKKPVISQDELLPESLKKYLARHKEIESKLSKKHNREYLVTDLTKSFQTFAEKIFGKKLKLKLINLKGGAH